MCLRASVCACETVANHLNDNLRSGRKRVSAGIDLFTPEGSSRDIAPRRMINPGLPAHTGGPHCARAQRRTIYYFHLLFSLARYFSFVSRGPRVRIVPHVFRHGFMPHFYNVFVFEQFFFCLLSTVPRLVPRHGLP